MLINPGAAGCLPRGIFSVLRLLSKAMLLAAPQGRLGEGKEGVREEVGAVREH